MKLLLAPITLASAQYLIIMPVLVLASFLLIKNYYKTKKKARALGAQHAHLVSNFSLTKKLLKTMLLLIGLWTLFIALLRPQWGTKEEHIMQEGRDLLIVLDISRSMLAQDCKPSRLQCAKEKIKQLVTLVAPERVGLLLFSGSAVVQCPLTADYNAFLMFLDDVDVETVSASTTAIGSALLKTIELFSDQPTKKHKLVTLFTDGEDFSTDLSTVQEQARELGLCMFVIGVGTYEGAPIPLYDQTGKQIGHQYDEHKNLVVSRLNQELLQQLSQTVGGHYTTITHDTHDLSQLKRWIEQFEKEALEEKKLQDKEDQFYYATGISFLALLAGLLL